MFVTESVIMVVYMEMVIPEEEVIQVMSMFKVKGPVFPFPGDVRMEMAA